MSGSRTGTERRAKGQNLQPSLGGASNFMMHDMLPSAPQVTTQDLRDAALALVHRVADDAALPFPRNRLRLSDFTADQQDGMAVALMALGVKESPVPQWYRDPFTRDVKRNPDAAVEDG